MFNILKTVLFGLFLTLSALAASAYPVDNVFIRITDANGDTVSGGKVYFFTAGTTTPVDTYSCAAMNGGCLNAHPVVADSGGKVAAIFVPAASYKIRITDSAGTTLYEVDDYVITDIDAVNANNFPVSAKTTAYTIASTDDGGMIAADATSGALAITAQAQTRGNGFPFCVIKTDSSGNAVTVSPDVGETINGASSYSISTQYQSACFVSRGAAGWFIWAERDPAGTFSTATTFNETATFNDDIVAPFVTLTDAATIDWDMSTGTNFVVTIAGDRTLDAPTGETAGQFGTLRVIQDGTGSRALTFNAAYANTRRPNPTASSTTLYYYVVRGSDDVLLFRASPGGPYIIDSGSFSASATKDITGLSACSSIKLVMNGIRPANDGVDLNLQFSTDAASTWTAANWDGGNAGADAGAGFQGDGDPMTGDNFAMNGQTTIGNAAGEGLWGVFEISNFNQTTNKVGRASASHKNTSGALQVAFSNGFDDSGVDFDSIRIIFSAGNIAATGTYEAWCTPTQ